MSDLLHGVYFADQMNTDQLSTKTHMCYLYAYKITIISLGNFKLP